MAFFGMSSALTLQIALVRPSLDIETARRVQRSDRVYGIMAGLVLVFGFLRVFYFEKGADYYFNNTFFLIKLSVFVIVGLMTIYPTVTFLRWNREIKQGVAPTFSEADSAKLRQLLHYQLIGICVVLFCASMMAKGFGYHG
jgi:putative membrane protein